MNKNVAKGRVRNARDEDIEYIYEWLRQQEEHNVSGSFLCNWNLTLESFQEGNLIAFVESKSHQAVAYQWGGLISPGILEVRKDMRGRGIGKRLVEYRIKQARKKDICVLRIQCKPLSSIPFWKKMGFQLINDNENYAIQILEYELPSPKEGLGVELNIGLYPNSRQWDENTQPSKIINQQGIMVNNRVIYLSQRVCIPNFQGMWDGDVVIEIIVSGKSIYVDKAKYEEARELGVERVTNGYLIDRIYLENQIA